MAMDGMIGKKIKFEDWKGDTRTGEVVSILKNGDYEVSTDRGMALVKNAEIIKMRKGGYVPKSVQMKREKVAKVMHEFKEGKLHSGSKNGPIVKDRDQAYAIALAEANSKKMGRGGDLPSIKGLKKLNAKRFHQGTDYIYHDMTTDKFYFVDFEGDVMEIKNDYFLSEIKKFYKMEKNDAMGWKHKMAKGGGIEQYQESEHLTQEQWEKWNEYVKTGKIDGKKENNIFAVARWVGAPVAHINAYEIERRSKRNNFAKGGSAKKMVDFSVIYFSPEWKNKSYSEKVEIETKRLDEAGIKVGDIVMNPQGMSGVVTLYNEKQSNKLDSPIMIKLDKPSAMVFGSDKGWIGGYYLYLKKGFMAKGGNASGNYVVRYDQDGKKAMMNTLTEAKSFVKVLKSNGHSNIEILYPYNLKTVKMAKGGGIHEADTIMYVELQSVGNVDFGDSSERHKNIPMKKVYVDSIEEAQDVVQQFIERHDLGSGNWTGGKVFKDGKNIGFIAYNGRFFEGARPYAKGGGVNKTEKMGKIKISDIEIGAKFKAKSGTVFIVDSTDGKIVESSLEGGAKGNYRDSIVDFVAFMNEIGATKIMATGGSMYADGGDIYVPVNKEVSKERIDDFVNYVEMFYGKDEDAMGKDGYTKAQIRTAVKKYLMDLERQKAYTWGNGDSLDRERVFPYLMNPSQKGIKNPSLAKGGALSSFNPKSFTLDELKDYLWENDIWFSGFQKGWTGITPASQIENLWGGTSHSLVLKKWKDKKLTISDYGHLEVEKGSENLYLDLIVYELDGSDDPYTIRIYTKDNHKGLKEFTNHIIDKFKKGGAADGVTEKITKARLKAKLYKPTGDFFIEDKSDKWFIHFTPKDADRNSQNLSDLNAESVGKGYYGSAYSVDKVITHSYSKGGSMGWKHKMAKGGLSNISFNRAELKKLSDDYYNVYLYKDNVVVYKGTLPSKQAVLFAEKTKNVKMIK